MRRKKPAPSYAELPDTELRSDVNRASLYARQDIDSLRRRLARFEIDADREQRIYACECKRCFYLRRGGLAGQAFTNKACTICATIVSYSTTHTQKYCAECASKYSLCRECGGDRDMKEREDPKPPRTRSAQAVWFAFQRKEGEERRQRVLTADREDREARTIPFNRLGPRIQPAPQPTSKNPILVVDDEGAEKQDAQE